MKTIYVLEQKFPIEGGDFVNAGMASVEVKSILRKAGIDSQNVRRISIAVYEAEMNVVLYTRRGELTLLVTPESVFIVFEDESEGIEDIAMAMREGYTTSDEKIRELGFGSGMGLPNIKANADYLKITSTMKKGTRLEMGFDLTGRISESEEEETRTRYDLENNTNLFVWKKKGYIEKPG